MAPIDGAHQEQGVGVAVSFGAEPFSESAGEDPLDGRHVGGLGRSQVWVDVGCLHAGKPRSRVPAKLVELLSNGARFSNERRTKRVQGGHVQWLVEEPLTEPFGTFLVCSEQRRFLRGEVVEEGPRRDVGRLGDVFDGHVPETSFGDQAEGDAADGAAGRELLALTQRRPLLVGGVRPVRGPVCDDCHALSVILHSR